MCGDLQCLLSGGREQDRNIQEEAGASYKIAVFLIIKVTLSKDFRQYRKF